jgi:hypothetical protein
MALVFKVLLSAVMKIMGLSDASITDQMGGPV